MNKLIGTMIRKYRLEKNYSQEGLCKGVCAVSYLSKIEQGSVDASPDILQGLLRRLGECFDDDPAFLELAGRIIEEGWQQVFRQGSCPEAESFIHANRDRLLHGPYLLDALLLEANSQKNVSQLREFVHCMDSRQYSLFLLLDDRYEEAVQCSPCGFVFLQAGSDKCTKGEYAAALRLLERAWQQSAEEASLRLMTMSKTMMGNVYSELQDWDEMDRCYQAALCMLKEINQPWTQEYISSIHYNIGATLLERQQYSQAWQQLLQCSEQSGLYCHKMAVAAEALDKREEALDWVKRGMELCDQREDEVCLPQRLELVRFRLEHPDYLQSGEYETMLLDCFYTLRQKGLQGHARFESWWVICFLQHKRRYKELSALLLQFSRSREYPPI